MKRLLFLLLMLSLLSACTQGERTPDKGKPLDVFHQEPVYLSEFEDSSFNFCVEDVADDYVTILAPLHTGSGHIRVFNVGNCVIECDLYIAPDQNEPVMTCVIQPEKSGAFINLSAEQYYYVGVKPMGSSVDVIIQD